MLSREAERIYWMGRYLERAEDMARLTNVNALLLLDLPGGVSVGWRPLVSITASEPLFEELYGEGNEPNVIRFLVGDQRNPGSILGCLSLARENARTIRDIIPREAWEEVNNIYLHAKEDLKAGLSKRGRNAYLTSIIRRSQLITGLLAGTMTHNYAYDFLKLGRNLERADMTSRIVDIRSQNLLNDKEESLRPFENIQWMSVLKSLSGYQMYRQYVRGPVRGSDVIHFLFKHEQFPRSVSHCVSEVAGCLRRLPRNKDPMKTLTRLRRAVRNTRPEDFPPDRLNLYIDKVQRVFNRLHQDVHTTYFSIT